MSEQEPKGMDALSQWRAFVTVADSIQLQYSQAKKGLKKLNYSRGQKGLSKHEIDSLELFIEKQKTKCESLYASWMSALDQLKAFKAQNLPAIKAQMEERRLLFGGLPTNLINRLQKKDGLLSFAYEWAKVAMEAEQNPTPDNVNRAASYRQSFMRQYESIKGDA